MEPTTDIEKHLRGASDAIMLLVAHVAELERHKRGVQPGNPRFDELARAVRRAADELADFARQEEEWAREATTQAPPETSAIDDTPPPRSLRDLLDHWRAVERELLRTDPGSEESERVLAEFTAARDRYMAAFRARMADD